MRESLKDMTTVERCRCLASELKMVPMGEAADEAKILEDAADEIESLRASYIALLNMMKEK